MVDVGGGVGSTSVILARAYPHLRFVVEDRKHVVEIAPTVSVLPLLSLALVLRRRFLKVWSGEHAELVKSGRVSFRPQDFLQPRPPSIEVPAVGTVSSPAVFLIRGCTHNWPDEPVRT